MLPQLLSIRGDLHHQLSSRRNDQSAWLAHKAFCLWWITKLIVKDSNQEGCRLAGARLGLADSIIALQGVGQNCPLYRGAVMKTQIGNPMHQFIT